MRTPHFSLALSLAAGTLALPFGLAATSPEFKKAEAPVTSDLKEAPSATDSIGETPESWIDSTTPAKVLPLYWLPKVRENFLPKTNQPFFDDARFTVRPRFYYFYRDIENVEVREAAAYGGQISLESGWHCDTFRVGATMFTSQKLYGKSDRDGTGLLRGGQESYTSLGEAFLDIRKSKTSLRIGRSRLDLPYINAEDFRMTPTTFEFIGFRSKEIENFRFSAGHINQVKKNTSTDFEGMADVAGAAGDNRGVSVLAARYEFGENSHVAAISQYGWDLFNTFYCEGNHLIEFDDRFKLRLGAQFTDQRSVGDELLGNYSTQHYGVLAALEYCNLTTTLAYTYTDRDAGLMKPWGGTPAYNSMIVQDFDRPGESAFRVGFTYDCEPHGIEGLSFDTSYVWGSTPDSGLNASPDLEEFNITMDYQPQLDLVEGFWFRVRYAHNNFDGGNNLDDFRVILNYSYQF